MDFMVKDGRWYFFSAHDTYTFPLHDTELTDLASCDGVVFDRGNAEDYAIERGELTCSIINRQTNQHVCSFYRKTLYNKIYTSLFGVFLCAGLTGLLMGVCSKKNRAEDVTQKQAAVDSGRDSEMAAIRNPHQEQERGA